MALKFVDPPPPGYTIREAAHLLHVSEAEVYRMIQDGELRAYKDISNRLRVPYGDLLVALREREKA